VFHGKIGFSFSYIGRLVKRGSKIIDFLRGFSKCVAAACAS
jgi:hypothetical protein